MITKQSREAFTSNARSAHSGRSHPGVGAVGRSGSGGNPQTSGRSDSTGGYQLNRLPSLRTSQTVKTRGT